MVQMLDCTLRDGRYYNDWDFEPNLVSKYLLAASSTNIDIIEFGFRCITSREITFSRR